MLSIHVLKLGESPKSESPFVFTSGFKYLPSLLSVDAEQQWSLWGDRKWGKGPSVADGELCLPGADRELCLPGALSLREALKCGSGSAPSDW